jgi:magnesium chelatase family protein
MLVATMNLCPCGARGDPGAECACGPQRLAAYAAKLSRALLDRFDLMVQLPRARAAELAAAPAESSAVVRERVRRASESLRAGRPQLDAAGSELLSRAVDRLYLSARARARVDRVAATIAVLAGAERARAEHVAEALSYRSPPEFSW